VAFEPCHYSPILQAQQDVTWRRLTASGVRMDMRSVRRWALSNLGDPVTYLSGYMQAPGGQPAYLAVHERVRDSLAKLEARLSPGAGRPLAVLAHSLGSVVVSNYVWNEQREAGEIEPRRLKASAPTAGAAAAPAVRRAVGRTEFERMETLTTLVTYGSTIPLFLPPSPPIECIGFPRATLPPHYRAVARWQNVFDPDDVLGYPLRGIWDVTHDTVIDDVVVNAGPWPVSATPFAHTMYDRDDDFLDLVARELRAALSVAEDQLPNSDLVPADEAG
jgi:hypothetical protein